MSKEIKSIEDKNIINLFGSYKDTIDALMTLKRIVWKCLLTGENVKNRGEKDDTSSLKFIDEQYILEKSSPYSSSFEKFFSLYPHDLKVGKDILIKKDIYDANFRGFSQSFLAPVSPVKELISSKTYTDLRYFAMRSIRNHYKAVISSKIAHLFHLLADATNEFLRNFPANSNTAAKGFENAEDNNDALPKSSKPRSANWDYKTQFLPYLIKVLRENQFAEADTQKAIDFFLECCREVGYIRPDLYKLGILNFRTTNFDGEYLISNLYGISTGIKGFDTLFGGGGIMLFEDLDKEDIKSSENVGNPSLGGRTILVRGRFGTGKSLLSLQLASEVARKGGIAWIMPLEQSAEECLYTLRSMNALPDDNLVDIVIESMSAPSALENPKPEKGLIVILTGIKDSFKDFLTTLTYSSEKMENFPLKLLCADPINSVFRGEKSQTELRSDMLEAIKKIEKSGTNILLVAEENKEFQDELAFEQNIADTVIRLSVEKKHGYALRLFEIMKSRFQREQRGEHPFSISPGKGITIYPSPAAVTARIQTRKPQKTEKKALFGLKAIDQLLGDNAITTGDIIVLQGAKGSYKTHLALLFLRLTDWSKDWNKGFFPKSLFISARDDQNSIIGLLQQDFFKHSALSRHKAVKGKSTIKTIKDKNDIEVCNLREGYIVPGYVFQEIEERVSRSDLEGSSIDRVAIDNIAHWEISSPFIRDDKTFGDTLVAVLRRLNVTSLLVCSDLEDDTDSVIQRSIIDSADCLIKFENFEFRGTEHLKFKILKTRNMEHRRDSFELFLTDTGLKVKPSLSLLKSGQAGEKSSTTIRLFFHSKNDIQHEYNSCLLESLKSVVTENIEFDKQNRIYTNTAVTLSSSSVVDELQILQLDEYQLPDVNEMKTQELLYKYSVDEWNEEWDTILESELKKVRNHKGTFFAVPYYVNISFLTYRKDLIDKKVLSSWSELEEACEKWEGEHTSSNDIYFDFPKHSGENFNCLFLEIILSHIPTPKNPKQYCVCCLINHPEAVKAGKTMRRLCHRAYIASGQHDVILKQFKDNVEEVKISPDALVWRHWYTTLNQMASTMSLEEREKISVSPLPNEMSISGNWYCGITSYSAAPNVGLEIINLFTSRDEEINRLQVGVGLPTRAEFYEQLDKNPSLQISPFLHIDTKLVNKLCKNSFKRSNIRCYLESTNILANHLQKVISIPESTPEVIEAEIEKIFHSLKSNLIFINACCKLCKKSYST